MTARFALCAAAMTLAGCVTLRAPAPKFQDYRLAYPPPAAERAPLPIVLRVAPFTTAALYAGDAIAYREATHSIGHYVYHRWATDPAAMVADLLTRDLVAARTYRAVQRRPSALRNDYELGGEIEEIEEQLGSSCQAHLQLRAILVRVARPGSDPVVFQRSYSGDEPCVADDPNDLVAAMSRGLARLSAQLQDDMYNAIAADLTKPPAPREVP